MLKEKLQNILHDLNEIDKKSYIDLLTEKVNNSLKVSYNNYLEEISMHYNYLLSRNNLKVMKNIERLRKSKERKNGK